MAKMLRQTAAAEVASGWKRLDLILPHDINRQERKKDAVKYT